MSRAKRGPLSFVHNLWFKITVPIVLAIGLLVGVVFLVYLPSIHDSLLRKEKESVRNVVLVVEQMVQHYYDLAFLGELSVSDAQRLALHYASQVRFGKQMKDYIFVSDLSPKMLMHPYRPDLNGQDMREAGDLNGEPVFMRMLDESRETGEAYVSYLWQWQDDETRSARKVSFVKRFDPWGWMIGSGVYLVDIEAEAAEQARRILVSIIAVLGVALALCLVAVRQSMKAEASIRDNEARLRGIFEQTVDVVLIVDSAGLVLQANQTSLSLSGSRPEDVQGKKVWDVPPWNALSDPGEMRRGVERAVAGEVAEFEARITPVSGGDMSLAMFAMPIRDDRDEIAYVLVEGLDISEMDRARKRLEEMNRTLESRVEERTAELRHSLDILNRTQSQLVQSEKMAALGELVAGVSHEVNTPLGLGVTNASFMQEQLEKIREKYDAGKFTKGDFETFMNRLDEALKSTLLNLRRGAEIIRSFKQVAVDQQVEERRTFNVAEYLDEVLLSLRPKYKNTGHEVALDCPDDVVVTTYPGALTQVLSNLIVNSLLHGFDGVESGRIEIGVVPEGEVLHLIYTDSGVGMTAEQKAKVFDPFFTTKQGRGGTGLGMHITYNLVVQRLCGSIELTTSPGQGVRFDIRIARDAREGECRLDLLQ